MHNFEVRIPQGQYGGAAVISSGYGNGVLVAPESGPNVAPSGVATLTTDLVATRVQPILGGPINTIGTPFTAPIIEPVLQTNRATVITPVTPMNTYSVVPSAIPVPVISPAVSTVPLPAQVAQPIVGFPTPSMTSVPLGTVPAAVAASSTNVQAIPTYTTVEAPQVPIAMVPPANTVVAVNTPTRTATVTTAPRLVGGAMSVGAISTVVPVTTAAPVTPVTAVAPLGPVTATVPVTAPIVTQVSNPAIIPASNINPAVTTQVASIPGQAVAVQTTYYKDPKDMTPAQRQKFKEQANFAKMTIQDYRNWLELYRNDITTLMRVFPAHVANFNKYISGQPLLISDLQLVVTGVVLPVAVKTPGLDTAQNLYNRYFLGDQYYGLYPEAFSSYPNVTTIPLQVATTPLPIVIS